MVQSGKPNPKGIVKCRIAPDCIYGYKYSKTFLKTNIPKIG